MLSNQRIPLNEDEAEAVDRLMENSPEGSVVGLTRSEPGETGPLRVEITAPATGKKAAAMRVVIVDEDGTTTEAGL
jgi:hypothetical protein